MTDALEQDSIFFQSIKNLQHGDYALAKLDFQEVIPSLLIMSQIDDAEKQDFIAFLNCLSDQHRELPLLVYTIHSLY